MGIEVRGLILHAKDNVAVALQQLRRGQEATYLVNESEERVEIIEEIPIYHKFALYDIKQGNIVKKYGETIGVATADIVKGAHVHRHNLVSECLWEENQRDCDKHTVIEKLD